MERSKEETNFRYGRKYNSMLETIPPEKSEVEVDRMELLTWRKSFPLTSLHSVPVDSLSLLTQLVLHAPFPSIWPILADFSADPIKKLLDK